MYLKWRGAAWEACSSNLEFWKPSQHSLIDTGKPSKTCAEMGGRRTFRILTFSQQSGTKLNRTLSGIFLSLRRIQRDMNMNVQCSSCKVPFLSGLKEIWIFWTDFLEIYSNIKFTGNLSMRAELFRAEEQTGGMKLIVASLRFAERALNCQYYPRRPAGIILAESGWARTCLTCYLLGMVWNKGMLCRHCCSTLL